ncbi:MAG: NAD(P)-dependent oxidoreductase [Alphaproteobacteria bacterium]
MKRVLVTGASGFVGAHLANTLAAHAECEVLAVGGRETPRIANARNNVAGDLAEPEFVRSLFAFEPFEAVVHARTRISTDTDPGIVPALVRDNVCATANLAAAAAAARCRRFIYCSSIAVYGTDRKEDAACEATSTPTPGRPMAGASWQASKLRMPRAAIWPSLCCGSPACTASDGRAARCSPVLRAALAGDPLAVNEPESRFRFAFVDDVADAIVGLLDKEPPPSGIFNVAGAETMTLREMAERIAASPGRQVRLRSPQRCHIAATRFFPAHDCSARSAIHRRRLRPTSSA